MSAHVIRDGTRVTILVLTDFRTPPTRAAVRAFAIGDHAVTRKHSVLPESDEPQWEVRTIGYLRPDSEGTRWCRGWKGKAAKALLAQVALENSR